MVTEPPVQELHQRMVRGIALTDAERVRLTAWYAEEDAAEWALLAQQPLTPTIAMMEKQLAAAIDRLHDVTRRVAELGEQNAAIRQEIAVLEAELARRAASRVA